MKRGFSIITAVLFLVIVSTIAILALSLSSISRKQTTDVFLNSQAQLLLRSGTEFALLAMSGHDYSTDCLNNVDISYENTFDINISIMYIGKSIPSTCNDILDNNISTSESNRTVIIDTLVTTKSGISSEPIKLHRRTIQKP